MSPVHLSPESIEAIAQRVADLLRGEDVAGKLIDAAEVARRFAVSREYVYEHAAELGAIRLGAGPKARLRFGAARVADRLAARPHPVTDPAPKAAKPQARRREAAPLLPIRKGA